MTQLDLHDLHNAATRPPLTPYAHRIARVFSDYRVESGDCWWQRCESEPDTSTVRTVVYVFPEPTEIGGGE